MSCLGIAPEVLAVLRCPGCGSELELDPSGEVLRSKGSEKHKFRVEDGFLTFAKPDVGKYNPEYAARYAALWAYGSETRHAGLDEPLYRTVSSLVAEALVATESPSPIIIDAGCGVGRVAADAALLAPAGEVIGIDASLHMLEYAEKVALGNEVVSVDLSQYGFQTPVRIPPRSAPNLTLLRADVEQLPIADAAADLILSVNIIDRLPNGPKRAFSECARVLRPGGRLVFTDPLNFTKDSLWVEYGTSDSILTLLKDCSLEPTTWFDDLFYREILDARGSIEEFKTLVVAATRA